jgi:hypothetical protein
VRNAASLLLALAVLALPMSAHAAALKATPAKPTDAMKLKNNGRTLEIASPSGVGSGELARVGPQWPGALKVRLKGLKALEHFRVTAGDMSLVCTLERPGGVTTERVCRLGDTTVDPPVQIGADFEVSVPPELLATHERTMVLEWVDSW